jgi:hypothetical protein
MVNKVMIVPHQIVAWNRRPTKRRRVQHGRATPRGARRLLGIDTNKPRVSG